MDHSKGRIACYLSLRYGQDFESWVFERTIQTLEDMLRACVLEFKDSWAMHSYLVEFAYNNSYQASIGMAPYKAFYRRKCRTPLCWDEVGERKLKDVQLIETTSKRIRIIRDRLKAVQDC